MRYYNDIDGFYDDEESETDALRERLRRADELLERVRQWFEQNEAALKRAGIGGFKVDRVK